MRIDLTFDDSTFKKYFKYTDSKGCKAEEVIDLAKISEVFELGEDDQSPISLKINKKYIDNNKNEKIKIYENVEVIDKKLLIEKLQILIEFWNATLKEQGIRKFDDLLKEKTISIYKTKIWDEFQRYRLYILNENMKTQNLEISLKNGFESHAPEKKMVKAKGKTEFSFENITKKYGILYKNMDSFDKYTIFSIIMDSFHLDIFTKELDPDDYDRFDDNAINFYTLESIGFFRKILGDIIKQPITLNLIGYDSIPKGIKAIIYDPTDLSESGIFLTINERLWRKTTEQKTILNQGKKKKKYMVKLPIEENYLLCEILKKCGYKILMIDNAIEENNKKFEIFRKNLLKEKNFLEAMENILTLSSVLDYYRTNEPDAL